MLKNDKLYVVLTILFFMFTCSNNFNIRKYQTITNPTQINQNNFKKILSTQAFEKNCKNPKIISNRYLQAECAGKESTLDLSNCLTNDKGILIYKENGQFDHSCSKCKLNFPFWEGKIQSTNFECDCFDKDIYESKTNISLKDFIYFEKGLKCADINQTRKQKPKAIDSKCILSKITEDNTFFSVCENLNIINFDINNCISNKNGLFNKGKSFFDNCYSCNIQKEIGNYFLSCDCEDENKSIRREYKPIHDFLEYKNSEVNCFNSSYN